MKSAPEVTLRENFPEPVLPGYAGNDLPSGVKLPPPHDIATQTSPLHVGIAESLQSTDAEHVVITAAVITMVFPVKGIVKDITVGSSTGETINQFVCKIRHELQLNVTLTHCR